MDTTVFKNVRVFDGDDVHQSATVVVKDGKISSVSSSPPPIEAGARTIDGAGHTLLPGLIEAHMHAHLATGQGAVQHVNPRDTRALLMKTKVLKS
jgi:imidazolonepropionase-like amidohydrolase